jgi:hypothetical protein
VISLHFAAVICIITMVSGYVLLLLLWLFLLLLIAVVLSSYTTVTFVIIAAAAISHHRCCICITRMENPVADEENESGELSSANLSGQITIRTTRVFVSSRRDPTSHHLSTCQMHLRFVEGDFPFDAGRGGKLRQGQCSDKR